MEFIYLTVLDGPLTTRVWVLTILPFLFTPSNRSPPVIPVAEKIISSSFAKSSSFKISPTFNPCSSHLNFQT